MLTGGDVKKWINITLFMDGNFNKDANSPLINIYRFNEIPIKLLQDFFCKYRQGYSKLYVERKKLEELKQFRQ